MWIKWKCEFCGEEFITGDIDAPKCPDCRYDGAFELGEVEVIDKEEHEGNSPLDEIAKIAHEVPFEVLKDIHQRIGDHLASGNSPRHPYIERQLEVAKEAIRLKENKMLGRY